MQANYFTTRLFNFDNNYLCTLLPSLRLDPVTGELTLVSAEGLDRERIPEYTLTVEARDDQGKGNRNTAEVHVILADANDNSPMFLQPRYDAVLNPDMKSFYESLTLKVRNSRFSKLHT